MLPFSQILVEIVEEIEIDRDFNIHHPDYPPLNRNPDLVNRLERIPPQLRSKYLIVQIQSYLHDIYFSHELLSIQETELAAQQPTPIKNNTLDGIDLDFYQQLQHSNTSNGYFDPDWQVVAQTEEDEFIVVKDGLHLHLNPHQHLPRSSQIEIGSVLPIYLPPNLVGRDTYIAVGNFGLPHRSPSVEIYFNFNPQAAVAIVKKLTSELNQLSIPFQFAILHHPDLFHRYDAGTLCLPQAAYSRLQPVLAALYQTYQAEFSSQIPLFTKQLAPGLGIAEVPTSDLNFGSQRCQLLATGLFTAMAADRTSVAKLHTINQEFTNAGIDCHAPHLNPTDRDCYNTYVLN